MEIVIRTRLKIIQNSLETLIESANQVLVKLDVNQVTKEEAPIVTNKLVSTNATFEKELLRLYEILENPPEQEISEHATLQLRASNLIAELETKTQQKEPATLAVPPARENIHVSSRLPRMELAKFDGDVLKWYEFWDQFSSNVDSRNISDVDKLLYLRSVLEGEAKQTVEGLNTTNKNYQIAVDTLKERYGKPSAIIDAHYVALYRIKTAGKSVRECRKVLNEVERHLRVLKSLGENVNHNHLRVMIMEKFPDLIYELRMKMKSEEESIEEIRKHLEHIVSARESSNRIKRDVLTSHKSSTSNTDNENFTLETFHVRAETRNDNRHTSSKGSSRNQNTHHNRSDQSTSSSHRKRQFNNSTSHNTEQEVKKRKISCIFCDQGHFNDECTQLKTIQERKSKLKGRCYNCLGEGHRAKECRSKRKCYHCGKFGEHNRALCPKSTVNQFTTKNFYINAEKENVLLQTAVVNIQKEEDDAHQSNSRILLDCGSQRSYITAHVAKELNLPVVEETCLSVYTFGAKHPQEIYSPLVHFRIVSRTNRSSVIYANVVSHITNKVRCPHYVIDISKLNNKVDVKNITMADDGSRGDEVDLLLGNDYYHDFMSNDKIEIQPGLFLINSDFGWIWSGKCNYSETNGDQVSVLTYYQAAAETKNNFNEPDLPLRNDYLKQLWDLEAIGIITDSPKTTRDDEAIKQFNETTKYINNRYYVTWPWIEYPPTLPSNFGLSWGRLKNLIKRLDSTTMKEYDRVIKEQLNQGVVELVPDQSTDSNPIHYLPHHCVLQANKSTKLRIVYDASAKIKNNNSLNECLYRGPFMLEDLTGLLIRFREHRIGITADVEKAFLQIGLQDKDKDVTRFLWVKDIEKEPGSDNLMHLRFCRVPFGIISSPFLLNATIKHHLEQSKDLLKIQVAEDIYVDNLVTGANTNSQAMEMYRSCKNSFNELNMNLREWYSNSKEFVNSISNVDQGRDTDVVNMLGIAWDLNNDELYLNVKYDTTSFANVRTKRDVLKVTASIYDPCGLVVPLILPAKLFLQDLWKQKIKWDTPLSNEVLEKWRIIETNFTKIKEYTIPRFYANNLNTQIEDKSVEKMGFKLHCFTDASMQAYSAVVYLRATIKEDSVISFIIGKSRLAPIKDQNDLHIPRLELLGAVIGNRLILYVLKYLRLTISKQFLWTDSQIVWSWYKSQKLLSPFVARRINEIKQNKSLNIRYVPTKFNPADVATRPNTGRDNKLWLTGPNFLTQNPTNWPSDVNTREENLSMMVQTFFAGECSSKCYTVTDESICRNANNSEESNFTEGQRKIENIIKLQQEHFPRECQGLETDLTKTLRTFKDKNGILRCTGRFINAVWPESQKQPILLPKKTEFTYKIIEETHTKNYHVGVSQTLALVRMEYWIPQGRAQVKRVIKKCKNCRKYGGGPYKLPEMAPLPAERVNYCKPFTYIGLDYFGPMTIKNELTEKRWVCLFTCLAVRAIHMEVVKDLTAEECLLALRRFVAIRGLPKSITSDNALQFKLTSEVLTSKFCIENEIKWKFIPELAPWCGGFYERLIGLVKHCLKRTIDKHLLNNNQLCTIIAEITAVVNTRPLTTVGEELEHVLTPSDFLHVGGPLLTESTDIEFLDQGTVNKINLIEGWKRGQMVLEEYAKMFINQYLTSLRNRKDSHKQPRVIENIIPKVGDIVQVKENNNRIHWKVGKIVKLVESADGFIRVAKVATSPNETLTRSIAHLYPLELEDKNQNISIDINVPENQLADEKPSDRPLRVSAQKARQKIKNWTTQLFVQ